MHFIPSNIRYSTTKHKGEITSLYPGLPTILRAKEEVFLLLEPTHYISVAQAKQSKERRFQTTADQAPGLLP